MKIKTKKKMRLDELINYIYDKREKVAEQEFRSEREAFVVKTNHLGRPYFNDYFTQYCIDDENTFCVEVKEELTKDTNLRGYHLKGIGRYSKFEDYRICTWPDGATNIKKIIKSPLPCDLKSLHVVNEDGVFTLIYTEEHGIPEEGVLEVSE